MDCTEEQIEAGKKFAKIVLAHLTAKHPTITPIQAYQTGLVLIDWTRQQIIKLKTQEKLKS
jgi:hypothetical protein